MFPRTVSTTRRVHARVRALKNLCLHTFRIRNTCKCVTFNTTPCLSHNYPPMYLKRNTTTQLLNLRTLLCMQLLTYEAVFEYIVWPIRRTVRRVHCKKRTQLYTTLWLTGSCPCANIHIQGRVCVQCVPYVLWQASCFHANISTLSCSCTSSVSYTHLTLPTIYSV